jgi:hypothetical protein
MPTKMYFDTDEENEISFSGNGVDVDIEHHDGTGETYLNVTEIHWLYPTPVGKRVALESDIHSTGNTIDILRIKSVIVKGSKVKHEHF